VGRISAGFPFKARGKREYVPSAMLLALLLSVVRAQNYENGRSQISPAERPARCRPGGSIKFHADQEVAWKVSGVVMWVCPRATRSVAWYLDLFSRYPLTRASAAPSRAGLRK